jgi:hypothetical protein
MERIETMRAALERARATARGIEDRTGQQERALAEREKAIDQTLGNLRRDRDGLADGIDAVMLQRYAKIAARRRPAVAIAEMGTCLGCRVGLPPQLLIELRRGTGLIVCGNCQRILVLSEHS